MEIDISYTFDDVTLIPQYSDILPAEASIETTLCPRLHLRQPLMAAAMDTLTEWRTMVAFAKSGGIAVLHKNMTISAQIEHIHKAQQALSNAQSQQLAAACGIQDDERIQALIAQGIRILCLDSAHGYSKKVLNTVQWIRTQFPHLYIIAGNVVTEKGAQALVKAGANIVKVGIGSGSICTTRVVSGVGVPQLTAIFNVSKALKGMKVGIIADGGIRNSGDIVKALAAGAHAVMIGNLFAGTDETPTKLIEKNGHMYKYYRGMGSKKAMEQGSKDRYFQMGRGKLIPEGIEAYVPYKGSVQDVINHLTGGLRSGMGYLGADTIEKLQKNAQWIRITQTGLTEGYPHDVLPYGEKE